MNTRLLSYPHFFHVVLLTLLGLFIFGCAEPLFWAKPGGQAEDFDRDVHECREDLGLPVNLKGGTGFSVLNPTVGSASVAVEQCLAGKGWYLARKPAP